MKISAELIGLVVSLLPLIGCLAGFWLELKTLSKQDKKNALILAELGKRISKIEKYLIKRTEFDKDTDSGFFG